MNERESHQGKVVTARPPKCLRKCTVAVRSCPILCLQMQLAKLAIAGVLNRWAISHWWEISSMQWEILSDLVQ